MGNTVVCRINLLFISMIIFALEGFGIMNDGE